MTTEHPKLREIQFSVQLNREKRKIFKFLKLTENVQCSVSYIMS